MPPETRTLLEAFVRGLNHQIMHVRPLPSEFDIFGLQPEPWTVADILTLGRLVSADINWIVWFQLVRFRADSDWPDVWRKIRAADGLTCWTNDAVTTLLAPLATGLRAGSNSFVVAPSRSAAGGAIIASDPHLSMALPNAWLLAAFKSPSYYAVGVMLPGLPFVALGRNPWIAWGGTSLHAASSDLVAISAEQASRLSERHVDLAVRWGGRQRMRTRESQ
jgi:penicillin G amidase